jgi:hypothetical protein
MLDNLLLLEVRDSINDRLKCLILEYKYTLYLTIERFAMLIGPIGFIKQ